MALGLYKPGQGYWVRVMTATFGGLLVLMLSAWLWAQLEGASDKIIPIKSYSMTLSPASGTAKPGDTVSLHGESAVPGQPGPEVGRAVIRQADQTSTGGDRVTIDPPTFQPGHEIGSVREILPIEGSSATLRGQITGGVTPMRLFPALYLQAGGVSLVMLLGSVLLYWIVATRPASVEFLIATDGEMRKVNWSTRKNIVDSTLVVILWSVALATTLFVVDYLFSLFFRAIGVLQH